MRIKIIVQIILISVLSLLLIGQTLASTEEYTFVTKWGSQGSGDGQFQYPWGIAVDTSGNAYVADYYNHRIQKFTSSGEFITKWGSYGEGDGQFHYPWGIAVDVSGNVYVADRNYRIQKFTSSGEFITKWGSYGEGDGQFSHPCFIAVDVTGNVYVTDYYNHRIQKFTSSGEFITKWGSYGEVDGHFRYPVGIAVDVFGNVYVSDRTIYVSDSTNRIQVFKPSDAIPPLTAINLSGTLGNGDWYISDVSVTLTATDNTGGSGVAKMEYSLDDGATQTTYTAPFSIVEEEITTILAKSTDEAGNVEEPPVSKVVKVDETPPAINISSPTAKDYLHSENITIQFTVEDNVSGIVFQSAKLNEVKVANGEIIDLLTLNLGSHVFKVTTTDNAGNSSDQTVAFSIIATSDSTSAAIDSFLQSGTIDSAGIANSLAVKLNAAQKKINQGNIKAAEKNLQAFINHVEAQSGKHITVEAADILIADAEYMIGSLLTAAPSMLEPIPQKPWLGQNMPNPFNPDTWIPYGLHERADVTISIYSSSGRLIRTLYLGRKDAGLYVSKDRTAYWNGRNASGEAVSSGVYFVRMKAGEFGAIRKMMILK